MEEEVLFEISKDCRVCGKPLDTHQKCDACGILIGGGHGFSHTIKFMEHQVCGYCYSMGKVFPYESWEEFCKGRKLYKIRWTPD